MEPLSRSDRLLAGHPDGPRGHHQEPGPGAEPPQGEDQPAGGGEGGSAEPEPGRQRSAQTASGQTGAGIVKPSSILIPRVSSGLHQFIFSSSSSSSVSARGASGLREGALQAEGALRGGDAPLQGGAGQSAGGAGEETPGDEGGGAAGEGGGEAAPRDGESTFYTNVLIIIVCGATAFDFIKAVITTFTAVARIFFFSAQKRY